MSAHITAMYPVKDNATGGMERISQPKIGVANIRGVDIVRKEAPS